MTGAKPPLNMWLSVMHGNNFIIYASINHPKQDRHGGVSQQNGRKSGSTVNFFPRWPGNHSTINVQDNYQRAKIPAHETA
jgi:hypothetical protein